MSIKVRVRSLSASGSAEVRSVDVALCEHWSLPPFARDLVIGRGLVFVTELTKDDGVYGGAVVAGTFEAAAKVCEARKLGEKVLGTLVEEIPFA